MQGTVLTDFESPSYPQHACKPPISCDVPEGHAGCTVCQVPDVPL